MRQSLQPVRAPDELSVVLGLTTEETSEREVRIRP